MATDPKIINGTSCDTKEASAVNVKPKENQFNKPDEKTTLTSESKVPKDVSNEEPKTTCGTEIEGNLSTDRPPSDICSNQTEETTQKVKPNKPFETRDKIINREVYNFLKNLLVNNLSKDTEAEQIRINTQLHVALQFFITGELQGEAEDVSQALTNLISCLIEVAPQFIKFPDAQEAADAQRQFHEFGERKYGTGFPNVLGIVDCIHIRVQQPSSRPEIYRNRHSHHSINVQIVCGPDLQIYNVLAAFPGGMEDACIWQCSNLRQVVSESDVNNGWLLGDSNYPQEPWLMTPLTKPKSPAEKLYNKVHTRTWNQMRGCVGLLKSRFGCLRSVLNYEPKMACAIITACCVLHNVCLQFGDVVEINPAFTKAQIVDITEITVDSMEEGVDTRNDLIKNSFSG